MILPKFYGWWSSVRHHLAVRHRDHNPANRASRTTTIVVVLVIAHHLKEPKRKETVGATESSRKEDLALLNEGVNLQASGENRKLEFYQGKFIVGAQGSIGIKGSWGVLDRLCP